jgi:hypothetical protein
MLARNWSHACRPSKKINTRQSHAEHVSTNCKRIVGKAVNEQVCPIPDCINLIRI